VLLVMLHVERGLLHNAIAQQKSITESKAADSCDTSPEEEEGLQGVFKRLRRNGHQLEKGCFEQLSSDCHSKGG
jgi:hypothetical protein